jgi:hypothetical protein
LKVRLGSFSKVLFFCWLFISSLFRFGCDCTAQFDGITTPVLTKSMNSFKTFQLSLHTAGVAISSSTAAKNEVWPFVTVSDFETKAQHLVQQLESRGGEDQSNIVFSVVVQDDQRDEWESYSVANQGWIQDGHQVLEEGASSGSSSSSSISGSVGASQNITPYIHVLQPNKVNQEPGEDTTTPNAAGTDKLYIPIWQVSPPPLGSGLLNVNFNLRESPFFQKDFEIMQKTRRWVLTRAIEVEEHELHPMPRIVVDQPIFEQTGDRGNVVALLHATVPFDIFFRDSVPVGTDDIVLVLTNTCNQTYSYLIKGPDLVFMSDSDLHDTKYDEHEVRQEFRTGELQEAQETTGNCPWTIHLYPTDEFRDRYTSDQEPRIFTTGVVLIFSLVAICFIMYDCFVERRQVRDVRSAAKSNAIISSLFPAHVRATLLEGADESFEGGRTAMSTAAAGGLAGGSALTRNPKSMGFSSKPIADLFPNCTVMFADIVGFTAWSSVREPVQVFILLESVYHAFDTIANQRRVFKVETIGDCYVAVTGLPEPRKTHAVVMARFANACMIKMKKTVGKLEVTLG